MTASEAQALFDTTAQNIGLGRAFDFCKLPANQTALLKYAQSECQRWADSITRRVEKRLAAEKLQVEVPQIYVGILDRTDLNAWAFIGSDDIEFIGITWGTILILRDLFDRMLSRPDVLVHIGNPQEETRPLKNLPDPVIDADALHSWVGQGLIDFPCIPLNSTRRHYANLLFNAALLFLAGHETAHLINGHVTLINKLLGRPFIAEAFPTRPTTSLKLINQVIEFDADCSGTNELIEAALNAKSKPWPWEGVPSGLNSIADLPFYTNKFAITSIFRLFGDTRPLGSLEEETYPSFRHRTLLTSNVAVTWLLMKLPEAEAAPFIEAIIKADTDVEVAFGVLLGTGLQIDYLLEVWGEDVSAHARLLLRQWRDIVRPSLNPSIRPWLAPGQTEDEIDSYRPRPQFQENIAKRLHEAYGSP